MTKLKIKVTRKEILSGECGEPRRCAIALAVIDIFPNASVPGPFIRPHREERVAIALPEHVREFVTTFDSTPFSERGSIPEIEFEIDIPDEVINTINIEEIKPLLINHPNLQLC